MFLCFIIETKVFVCCLWVFVFVVYIKGSSCLYFVAEAGGPRPGRVCYVISCFELDFFRGVISALVFICFLGFVWCIVFVGVVGEIVYFLCICVYWSRVCVIYLKYSSLVCLLSEFGGPRFFRYRYLVWVFDSGVVM